MTTERACILNSRPDLVPWLQDHNASLVSYACDQVTGKIAVPPAIDQFPDVTDTVATWLEAYIKWPPLDDPIVYMFKGLLNDTDSYASVGRAMREFIARSHAATLYCYSLDFPQLYKVLSDLNTRQATKMLKAYANDHAEPMPEQAFVRMMKLGPNSAWFAAFTDARHVLPGAVPFLPLCVGNGLQLNAVAREEARGTRSPTHSIVQAIYADMIALTGAKIDSFLEQ